MDKNCLRIAIDFHNLSVTERAVVRTGIQQVVFEVLRAQWLLRSQGVLPHVEFFPLPCLPHEISLGDDSDAWRPVHHNNSSLVLEQTATEISASFPELWNSVISTPTTPLSDKEYYRILAKCDWLLVTGLCEFRYVLRRAQRSNPRLQVAVIHYDLVPVLHPYFCGRGMPEWFSSSWANSIGEYADLIFCISRHTALDAADWFFLHAYSADGVVATPLPGEIPPATFPADDHPLLARLHLKPRRYFVCLGTLEPRKNLLAAIRGFRKFHADVPAQNSDIRLVVIGMSGWKNEDARLLADMGTSAESIIFPGYLERSEIDALVAHAAALIMPSRYEGYGLPISLAFALGVPTITCVNSSLPEVTLCQSYFVAPDRPHEMAVAMIAALTHERWQKPISAASVQVQWQELLKGWVEQMQAREVSHSVAPEPSPARLLPRPRSAGKTKILIDVHNLSLFPDRFVKTGIQEVVFSILQALPLVRKRFGREFDILALPWWPCEWESSPGKPVDPALLKQLEGLIGVNSEELWGFPLHQYRYSLRRDVWQHLVTDARWLLATAQLDLLAVVPKVNRVAPRLSTAAIFYDIIPTLIPGCIVPDLWRWFNHTYLRGMQRHADLVVANSRHSALDLLEHKRLRPSTRVISRHLPMGNTHNSDSFDSPIPHSPYLVVMGSREPRKNLDLLVRGFLRFHDTVGPSSQFSTLHLVIIGPRLCKNKELEAASRRAQGKIIDAGYCDDHKVQSLIAGAVGLCMPSRYEGYGVPIAMARAHHKPVLTCINSSLPEVATPDSVFVSPHNVDSMAMGIHELVRKARHNPAPLDSWVDFVGDLIEMMIEKDAY